jgi:hypothetical protein
MSSDQSSNEYYSDSTHKYWSPEVEIKKLTILIDTTFAVAGDWIIQLSFGIRMGANCVPLLADLF